jgi:hypothetical protein
MPNRERRRQAAPRPWVRICVLAGMTLGAATLCSGVALAQPGGVQPRTASPAQAPAAAKCSAHPDFVGKMLGAAKELARRCGYHFESIYRVPEAAPAGTVVSVGPADPPYYRVVVSTGPLSDRWTVLPGAPGPPVASECTATLELFEDGTAGPLTCGATHVNAAAWYYYALLHPPVMGLPRRSPVCEVAGYIDLDSQTTPISDEALELASAYNGWNFPEGLAAHILVATPYNDRCPSFTARLRVAPVDRAGRIGYGYVVARAVEGSCRPGSPVSGAAYTCTSKKLTLDACWRGTSGPSGSWHAVCMAEPWSWTVTVVSAGRLPAPAQAVLGLPWGLQLSGIYCVLLATPFGSYGGQPVRYGCEGSDVRLVGVINKGSTPWRVRSVRWTGTKYVPGPNKAIVGAWSGEPTE